MGRAQRPCGWAHAGARAGRRTRTKSAFKLGIVLWFAMDDQNPSSCGSLTFRSAPAHVPSTTSQHV
jgi:hypothetical protein